MTDVTISTEQEPSTAPVLATEAALDAVVAADAAERAVEAARSLETQVVAEAAETISEVRSDVEENAEQIERVQSWTAEQISELRELLGLSALMTPEILARLEALEQRLPSSIPEPEVIVTDLTPPSMLEETNETETEVIPESAVGAAVALEIPPLVEINVPQKRGRIV